MKHIVDIYIRDAKIVMYGPYCVHIWLCMYHCGFAEHFPAITWHVLAKSNRLDHTTDHHMEE